MLPEHQYRVLLRDDLSDGFRMTRVRDRLIRQTTSDNYRSRPLYEDSFLRVRAAADSYCVELLCLW